MNDFSYEIIAVHYEKNQRSIISHFKVKNPYWVGETESIFDRLDMIIRIDAGFLIGVRKKPTDQELTEVIIEKIEEYEFIKTTKDGKKQDNLGDVLTFE